MNFLRTIERPTLIINALDDPFMTPDVIPDPNSLSDIRHARDIRSRRPRRFYQRRHTLASDLLSTRENSRVPGTVRSETWPIKKGRIA